MHRNILCSSLTVRVEDCKKTHKKKCSICGCNPADEGMRRLFIQLGAGRSGVKAILCTTHGVEFLAEKGNEVQRAILFLKSGNGSIRSPQSWKPRPPPKPPKGGPVSPA